MRERKVTWNSFLLFHFRIKPFSKDNLKLEASAIWIYKFLILKSIIFYFACKYLCNLNIKRFQTENGQRERLYIYGTFFQQQFFCKFCLRNVLYFPRKGEENLARKLQTWSLFLISWKFQEIKNNVSKRLKITMMCEVFVLNLRIR